MADQLCTPAQVKARLRIPTLDTTDDALISELIDGVTDWIQDRTRRKLVPENAATYILDTSYGSLIDFPRGIRAVTTLEVATTGDLPDDGSGTYTAVAAADIILRPTALDRRPGWPATQLLIRGSSARLIDALNAAKLVGNFGFSPTPPRLVEVAIDAAVVAYGARGKPSSPTIGADARAAFPWASFFGEGTAQLDLVDSFRPRGGIG